MVPNQKTIKFVLKPLLFIACLIPFALLALKAFGVAGAGFGPNPVEEVLHELGLWGLRFLLITLLITPLKDILHKPWPIALRRMLGLFAFFYVTMHFVTWLWLDRELYWPGILEDIGKRPFITLGFAAFVLLIPMAMTSTNGWIRRMGAQRWRALHKSIYVIVLLGVWHFYWLVKSDVREPLVYLGIALVLLGWRVWKALQKRRATKSA